MHSDVVYLSLSERRGLVVLPACENNLAALPSRDSPQGDDNANECGAPRRNNLVYKGGDASFIKRGRFGDESTTLGDLCESSRNRRSALGFGG